MICLCVFLLISITTKLLLITTLIIADDNLPSFPLILGTLPSWPSWWPNILLSRRIWRWGIILELCSRELRAVIVGTPLSAWFVLGVSHYSFLLSYEVTVHAHFTRTHLWTLILHLVRAHLHIFLWWWWACLLEKIGPSLRPIVILTFLVQVFMWLLI